MRTESPEEVTHSSARSDSTSTSVDAIAKCVAKLAGYAIATVAVTFALLRPNRARSNNRGSLFLGSGVLIVLIKMLLSVSEGSGPGSTSGVPVLAAAAAAPVAAPVVPAKAAPVASPRKRSPSGATVARPRPQAKPQPTETKRNPPAVVVPTLAATVVPPAVSKPRPAGAARTGSALGPRYADKAAGYSVQFPTGWTQRPVKDAGCWVMEAGDGGGATISVGFSKFPAAKSVDEVIPAKITRSLQQRAGTVVHASGYATLGGRRCLWHKYTGPISRPNGSPRMTAVHYWLPLQDGRALEVRVAAAPEKFNEIALRMKQSVDSLKLLTRIADAGSR